MVFFVLTEWVSNSSLTTLFWLENIGHIMSSTRLTVSTWILRTKIGNNRESKQKFVAYIRICKKEPNWKLLS